MTKLTIPADQRALYDKVVSIDHISAVTSAVAAFRTKHATNYGEVQDGLRDAFFQSAYGQVMYYDYHLPKYIAARDALDGKIKDAAYLAAAKKKVDTKAITDPAAQDANAKEIASAFTVAEKEASLDVSDAAKALHSPIINSEEYKYAISAAMPYVSQIKEAFLLTESAIAGKLNFDLIQNAGRNLTLYDVARLDNDDLSKVAAGEFGWKALFENEDKAILSLQIRSGTPAKPIFVGAFVGGLANTGEFSSPVEKNIDAFITWIQSDVAIEYVFKISADNSQFTDKEIAGFLSTRLMQDLPGVEVLWAPLETIVTLIKANKADINVTKQKIDEALKKDTPLIDNLKFNPTTKKFELLPLSEVAKNNIFREGSEELGDITFTASDIENHAKAQAAKQLKLADVSKLDLTNSAHKDKYNFLKKAIGNKAFAITTLKNYSPDENRDLLVGGEIRDENGDLIGLARDPQFPNSFGFNLPSDVEINRTTLFAVPECYANKVAIDKREEFRTTMGQLKTMQGTANSEMQGSFLTSLWNAAKYAGSVVNTEANFFTPLGDGSVLDPSLSKKIESKAAYPHEGQVPVVMMTRYVLAQSVAAVVNNLREAFFKSNPAEEVNFEEFLHYVQDLGFAAAIKKLTTGVINISDKDQDTQEKVDALTSIKFKAVAQLISSNKSSIIADAKRVFETNYIGEEGLMTLLAKDLSSKDEALALEASADLIFWQTDDSLACLAQNYFGDADTALFGRDFARSMLSQASKIGVDTYVAAHQDVVTQAQLDESFLLDLRTEEVNDINDAVSGLTGEAALTAYYEILVY